MAKNSPLKKIYDPKTAFGNPALIEAVKQEQERKKNEKDVDK